MKVTAFNGSPRKDGNTFTLLNIVLDELKNEGIETELYQLGGRGIHGCIACYKCAEKKNKRCSVTTDCLNECVEKMLEADGIIIGSPTYFSNVTADVKALIDRAGLVAKVNGSLFKRKVGAAVTAVRRAGSLHAFNSINHLFTINEMIIPGSNYWNMGIGREKGEVLKDEEGVDIMRTLGRNMAWLMKKLNA
ncbi:MAG: flavodoxin family protein [Planctomycetota bacterium]|jgi:multimeric flavodoxin WrbA